MSPAARRPRLATRLAALLGALALAASACAEGPPVDVARVLLAGDLHAVTEGDGARVRAGDHLSEGAELRTGASESRLQFRSGQVWLAPGTRATLRPDGVALLAGDLVVASDGSVSARLDDMVAAGDGVFRITSGVSPLLAVYAGEVTLVRPGQRRAYPRLREVGLASARLPGTGDPLGYRATDRWDQRLLPAAITFDAAVARVAAELDREYGTGPHAEHFYRSLQAAPDGVLHVLRAHARHTREDGAFGPASDALVTVFVAEAVAARHDLPVEQAVDQVADLRALGARWGAVAIELGIHARDLTAIAELAASSMSPARDDTGSPGVAERDSATTPEPLSSRPALPRRPPG